MVPLSANLRERTRQAMIERDAAVLHVVALQQLAEAEATASILPGRARELMSATLRSARQPGMLAVVTFDANGKLLQAVPPSLLLPELSNADFLQLLGGARISRFHAQFPLDRHFREVSAAQREAPVLEIILPLHDTGDTETVGFAQYLIDARVLARDLDTVDRQIQRQTGIIFGLGAGLIALLATGAYLGLRRAHAQIAERSERLARAQLELTLAAKVSALGQLTSHLIHGLQGPVAGLRAIIDQQRQATPNFSFSAPAAPISDLDAASAYTERLENLVQETITLLSDNQAQATYELSGEELLATLRQRAEPFAVEVSYTAAPGLILDNHRGNVLCLITANLLQNASEAGATRIEVHLSRTPFALLLTLHDNGPGIPESMRAHLFEPGRSTRSGGSGIGLAISRLLARQIDAQLDLDATGAGGTTFSLRIPLRTAASDDTAPTAVT